MDFNRLIITLKGKWNTLVYHVDQILNVRFQTTSQKRLFLAMVAVCEILIFYAVAVLDMGLWIGDSSIPGLIAGYLLSEQSYPWLLFLLAGGGLLVFLYYYLRKNYGGNTGRGFDISESNVYGSANEITREKLELVAEICPIEAAMGTILGKMDESDRELITSRNNPNFNKNAFFLAPPGSGKTHCIVLPGIVQAIRRGESIVTTDTKGELWAKTAELARSHGYTLRRIDFKDPDHSDGWDVLGEVRHSSFRAKIAASVYIANTESAGSRDIHAASEENLLAALMLYTDMASAIPEDQRSLYQAYSLLISGTEIMDASFGDIMDDPEMRVVYDFYSSFQGTDNLRTNIISGLAKRMNILADPSIRRLTSTPDIDLTLPGKEKCIYYVELPDQHGLVRFLSSLFFSFLFLDLAEYADSRMDQKLPVPVNVIVEEAFACGKIETLTNALSTLRSRGVGITLIAQGIPQFLELYGDNITEIIQEDCATFGCLSANGKTTAEFFSWLSGVATVDVKTEHHVVGEGPFTIGRTYTTGQGRQELFTDNDVRKIEFGRILLVWQRMDPKLAYTFGIHEHPEFIKGRMPQISAHTNVSIHDVEARAYLRRMEDLRVQAYKEWIALGGNPWPDYTEPRQHIQGPCTNMPLPEIIPYAELERMALTHSASLREKTENNSPLQKALRMKHSSATTINETKSASSENPSAAQIPQMTAAQQLGYHEDFEDETDESAPTEDLKKPPKEHPMEKKAPAVQQNTTPPPDAAPTRQATKSQLTAPAKARGLSNPSNIFGLPGQNPVDAGREMWRSKPEEESSNTPATLNKGARKISLE